MNLTERSWRIIGGTTLAATLLIAAAYAGARWASHDTNSWPSWISALATLATAGAVVVAWLQLRETRAAARAQAKQAAQTALEQARPYVVLGAERSRYSLDSYELVLRNIGAGPAYDVTITVDPPLVRANEVAGAELAQARMFTAPIAMIPPRYELRSWLDKASDRADRPDLPDLHQVTVTYRDGHSHAWAENSALDLSVMNGLMFPEEYGLHDLAVATRTIAARLEGSPLLNGRVDATTETRKQRAERTKSDQATAKAAHERLRQARAEALAGDEKAAGGQGQP